MDCCCDVIVCHIFIEFGNALDHEDACAVGGFVEDFWAVVITYDEEGATGLREEGLIFVFVDDNNGFDVADFAVDEECGVERHFGEWVVAD